MGGKQDRQRDRHISVYSDRAHMDPLYVWIPHIYTLEVVSSSIINAPSPGTQCVRSIRAVLASMYRHLKLPSVSLGRSIMQLS